MRRRANWLTGEERGNIFWRGSARTEHSDCVYGGVGLEFAGGVPEGLGGRHEWVDESLSVRVYSVSGCLRYR